MKLPDFFRSDLLNELKTRMGRAPNVYGSFSADPARLTAEERVLLESGKGIEVSFDQLTVLADKTLSYKDGRVLLYIRDVHAYGGRRDDWYPRYHLSHCKKLEEMTSAGRFERYVIASETSGEFLLNMIVKGSRRSERKRIPVCQICLENLSFDGFSLKQDRHSRRNYVSAFTPAKFFAVYPRSLHSKKPTYTSTNAPLDDYTDDFPKISRLFREQAGWRCSKCRKSFSLPRMRQYLHVHHKNGDRRNNSSGNLVALCIVCHAEEPMHQHLKRDPRYAALRQEVVTGTISG
jgi:hypothetical protein